MGRELCVSIAEALSGRNGATLFITEGQSDRNGASCVDK